MKSIVLSIYGALLLTVGAYELALICGFLPMKFVGGAIIVVLLIDLVITLAVTAIVSDSAAVHFSVTSKSTVDYNNPAFITVITGSVATKLALESSLILYVCFGSLAFIAYKFALETAKKNKLRRSWVIGLYVVEAITIIILLINRNAGYVYPLVVTSIGAVFITAIDYIGRDRARIQTEAM